MKKMMIMATVGVAGMFTLSGCGQSVPERFLATEDECTTLEKKLIQTNQFIEKVSSMNPAHVDEMMLAVPKTEITTATSKSKILKDAYKRKARLETDIQSAGCAKAE
ncbi:hypothetical protein ACM66Z_02625 [Sulfurovum sp. ST-21]|uniref:Lipoprotein n=1 Tax=Sulfurovum indicum TaxID=2779528 RepID=A0A7M1S4W2_9BACT|nr:hypothetical protein [Sulfurovum indicum]QOR62388.1 hypothetical protein IMZ28_02615 [Sulfurovum indicum]